MLSRSAINDNEMKIEPLSPTEKYLFPRCNSTGSLNTPGSSAHNSGMHNKSSKYQKLLIRMGTIHSQIVDTLVKGIKYLTILFIFNQLKKSFISQRVDSLLYLQSCDNKINYYFYKHNAVKLFK